MRTRGRRAGSPAPEPQAEIARLRLELEALREALGLRQAVEALPESFEAVLGSAAGEALAVPLSQVVEVVPRVLIAPLPEAPTQVAGYMRWRGRQVVVLDMGRLLTGRALDERLEDRILLVRQEGDEPRGLLVSEVEGVARIDRAALSPPPPDAVGAAWALGFVQVADRPHLVVSLEKLLQPLASQPTSPVEGGLS